MDTDLNSEEVLDDAGMVQTQGEGTPAVPQAEAAATETEAPLAPESLGEALQAFNKAKSEAAKSAVPEGEGTTKDPAAEPSGEGEGGEGEPAAAGGTESADSGSAVLDTPQAAGAPSAEAIPGGTGEPTGNDEIYDADAGVAEVRQELVDLAVDAVRKDFAKKNIRKISVNDLIKVDERAGTKEFINPDTKRPFSSSNPRSEAQAFVNDYNADLDAQFNYRCQQIYPQIEQSHGPILRLHEFIPTWQKMDEFRKEMFEELVAGHELVDAKGEIVAYDCDLHAINNQMEKQVQWLLSKQQSLTGAKEKAEADPVTQPAVAAKTITQKTKAAKSDNEKYDLNNMSDALKYYNKQKQKNTKKED